jgi:hypothetical protein
MTPEEKLKLIEKMGLKPGPNFGSAPRQKVWRPTSGEYLNKVRNHWVEYDGISESSVRSKKALAAQRNRARRK